MTSIPATAFAPESAQASTSADASVHTPDTASNSAPATASDIASACVFDLDPAPPPASASAPAPASTSAYVSAFAPATASSDHRIGSGIPLIPDSFEETEWLVPPRDDTARLKARHAYNQWKQEVISLSSHDPHTSSGGRSISRPGRVNGSAAKNLVLNCNCVTLNATTTPASFTNQWVVKPKGDRD